MAFTCPKCGMTSHNPNDEREQYCGACHDWTGLPAPKAEDITSADLFLGPPDPFARTADVWVGNSDGTYMAWWCIKGVWHWRYLSVDHKVLNEGEGRP